MNSFLEKIKNTRLSKGYTQEFVGYKLGISGKAYSKIETGVNGLHPDYFKPLCSILGLPQKDMAMMFFDILEEKGDKIMKKLNTDIIYDLPIPNKQNINNDASLIISQRYCRNIGLNGLNNNVLLIGGAGTGKSRYFVKPNLLQMDSSFVVTDHNGEFLYSLGNVFKSNGYLIKILNLEDFEKSSHYNPFCYISTNDDIEDLCDCLLQNNDFKIPKDYDDPFYHDCIRVALNSILHYMYEYVENPTLRKFKKIINNINTTIDFSSIFESCNDNSISYALYKGVKESCGNTIIYVIELIKDMMNEILTENILCITDENNLDIEKFQEDKTVLFIMPDNRHSSNTLISIFYTQLLKIANSFNNEIPIKIIMDEFGLHGTIPDFMNKICTINNKKFNLIIILQCIEQLTELYPSLKNISILDIFNTILFLGGQEPYTLRFISDMIHNKDMTPDLIGRMNSKMMLIFEKGEEIMQDQKYFYENHDKFILTADYDDEKYAYKI